MTEIDYSKSVQIANDPAFIERLGAILLGVASEEPNSPVGQRILSNPAQAVRDFALLAATDEFIQTDWTTSAADLTDATILNAVTMVMAKMSPPPAPYVPPSRFEVSQSPEFQSRVYQSIVDMANNWQRANPTPNGTPQDAIMRLFAAKLIAGRFQTPQHRYTFAQNVMADADVMLLDDPSTITDEAISAALGRLLAEYVKSVMFATAAGQEI
jgi:hypothetical protein